MFDLDDAIKDIQELSRKTKDNTRWLREVLIDFKIPYDDHENGRRTALVRWMIDRVEEIKNLRRPSISALPAEKIESVKYVDIDKIAEIISGYGGDVEKAQKIYDGFMRGKKE